MKTNEGSRVAYIYKHLLSQHLHQHWPEFDWQMAVEPFNDTYINFISYLR
jgi:hypothetical protein